MRKALGEEQRMEETHCKVVAEAPKDSLAEPAIYPVGVVSASKHKDAAEKFVEFLQSEEALKVFESYGFQKNAE